MLISLKGCDYTIRKFGVRAVGLVSILTWLMPLPRHHLWGDLQDSLRCPATPVCPRLAVLKGFLGGLDGKGSACNVGNSGLMPGLGRCPGEENAYPLQYSSLKNSKGRGAWQATVHRVVKSQTLTICQDVYSDAQSCLTLCDPIHHSPQAPLSMGHDWMTNTFISQTDFLGKSTSSWYLCFDSAAHLVQVQVCSPLLMLMGGPGPLKWPPRPPVPWVSWTDRESTQDHMVLLLRESKHSWNQRCYLPGLQVTLGNKTGEWASVGHEKDENKWTDSSVQLSQLGKWNGWGCNFALCLSGSHSELIDSL